MHAMRADYEYTYTHIYIYILYIVRVSRVSCLQTQTENKERDNYRETRAAGKKIKGGSLVTVGWLNRVSVPIP